MNSFIVKKLDFCFAKLWSETIKFGCWLQTELIDAATTNLYWKFCANKIIQVRV